MKSLDIAEYKNYVVSPLSIWLLLSTFYTGSRRYTQGTLRNALGLPQNRYSENLATQGLKQLVDSFQDYKKAEILLATKIYAQQGIPIDSKFERAVKSTTGAEIENIDFGLPGRASERINEWCRNKTHDLIHDIIKPSDVGPLTRAVALNAVYFKGTWETTFESVSQQKFHLPGTDDFKYVPMMNVLSKFRYGRLKDASYVEIPYKSESNHPISMFVIRPSQKDGMPALKKENLDIKKLHDKAVLRTVEINLPKFTISTEFDLTKALEKLGLGNLFTAPDFSGISPYWDSAIDKVTQKAFIQVDEQGTKAAVVTVSAAVALAAGPDHTVFSANHPCLIKIATVNENPVTLFDIEYAAQEYDLTPYDPNYPEYDYEYNSDWY